MALPIRFFTIVLNGMPFLRHHLPVFQQLSVPWEWHIAEGLADLRHDTAWSLRKRWSIRKPFRLQSSGWLPAADARRRPQHRRHQRISRRNRGCSIHGSKSGASRSARSGTANGKWCKRPAADLKTETLLWQIDSDELWTADQIHAAHEMFAPVARENGGPILVPLSRRTGIGNRRSGRLWQRAGRMAADLASPAGRRCGERTSRRCWFATGRAAVRQRLYAGRDRGPRPRLRALCLRDRRSRLRSRKPITAIRTPSGIGTSCSRPSPRSSWSAICPGCAIRFAWAIGPRPDWPITIRPLDNGRWPNRAGRVERQSPRPEASRPSSIVRCWPRICCCSNRPPLLLFHTLAAAESRQASTHLDGWRRRKRVGSPLRLNSSRKVRPWPTVVVH